MKVSEVVEKLLEMNQDLLVGFDDSEWGFEEVGRIEIGDERILVKDEVSTSGNPLAPSYTQSKDAQKVVVFKV